MKLQTVRAFKFELETERAYCCGSVPCQQVDCVHAAGGCAQQHTPFQQLQLENLCVQFSGGRYVKVAVCVEAERVKVVCTTRFRFLEFC